MRVRVPDRAVYAAIGLCAAAAGLVLGYTSLGQQFDNNVADWLARLSPLRAPARHAAVLAYDEHTLMDYGGIRGLRSTLILALRELAKAGPAVVAVDLTLADPGDPATDAELAQALAGTRNLVLFCEMLPDGSGWQEPRPEFRARAAAVGHVHAMPGPYDNINRRITLERVAGGKPRFALALEALRLASGARAIESSPSDLSVGDNVIESRWDEGRPLLIHYRDRGLVPHVSIRDLLRDPAAGKSLAGRVVFIGVTALSSSDRLFTPLSGEAPMAGVEIHAQAFETMASREFLSEAALLWPALLALVGAGLIAALFAFTGTRWAYSGGTAIVLAMFVLPWWALRSNVVLPPAAPLSAAMLALIGTFSYRFLVVRRRLTTSEQTSQRYQQAFRFVAHELRTPLTAIQGSGELLTRYNLPEEKRRQLAGMIQSESRRLAKMISTFLDVEKMSAGQMELRREDVAIGDLIATVVERAKPLAERKQIRIQADCDPALSLSGDRELLEYALYNLLTNAIKYSPPDRRVFVAAASHGDTLSLTVRDEGIGMDEEDLKKLFTRFFRSKRAEATGETGTGIGLAIVEQIVTQHGGRIEVQSKPGEGSAFTVLLPQPRA